MVILLFARFVRTVQSTLPPIRTRKREILLGGGGLLFNMAVLFGAPIETALLDDKVGNTDVMEPYKQRIRGTRVSFDMVPIPGGTFIRGSAENEAGRKQDEGPQHQVQVAPFWMGKCEVTWDEYDLWAYSLEKRRRQVLKIAADGTDRKADAVTRPTKPYTDMTFGMGKRGFPAICMTQLSAKKYCEWLSAKTGRYYRLPTEAEWEHACRAGTTTAYSFGDDQSQLGEYAWYYENSEDSYHRVGKKKPNPWGLYDMHGNVSEWCLDGSYRESGYAVESIAGKVVSNPFQAADRMYGRLVRGGSWDSDPEELRSAARLASNSEWKIQDPQIPQSIWFLTDALFVGFRVVCPLETETMEERIKMGPDRFQMDP